MGRIQKKGVKAKRARNTGKCKSIYVRSGYVGGVSLPLFSSAFLFLLIDKRERERERESFFALRLLLLLGRF